jgi:AhpD family alkylhydroperoxidase
MRVTYLPGARSAESEAMMKQRLDAAKLVPNGFAALLAVEKYVHESGLDPKLLALVKIRASQINGCQYCLHMHTLEAKKAGETEARIYLLNAWRESQMYTPRERAALTWTESLTHISKTHAPDEDYEIARAEFSEKELADLSIAIGMINLWNRVTIGARVHHPADKPPASA